MDLSQLRDLAARATPLFERFAGMVEDTGSETGCACAAARTERWERALGGKRNSLDERLAQENLDRADCHRFLGDVRLVKGEPLPEWAQELAAILDRFAGADWDAQRANDCNNLSGDSALPSALPFEDLFLPFLEYGRERVAQQAGGSICLLTASAKISLERYLMWRLTRLSSLTLGQQFYLFRTTRDPLARVAFRPTEKQLPPVTRYREFLDEMRAGGLQALFSEYPVLGRLLSVALGNWVEFVTEFCLRLQADLPAIRSTFTPSCNPGLICELIAALSDPHHRGRSVLVATFESGLKLVYKPKDLGNEAAFFELLRWFNTNSSPRPFRVLSVLNRSSHGWVEHVEPATCRDTAAVERYYHRMGLLLCVAYVLKGADFHCENLIASGDQPMLIDLESLLQPPLRPWDCSQLNSADHRASEMMRDSVLRTGLLPYWTVSKSGRSFDTSGIGAEGTEDPGYRQPDWEDINTDRMRLVFRRADAARLVNRPTLNGEVCSADEYAEEIADGFVAMYRLLIANRDKLLSKSSPLQSFRGLQLRCVLRPTQSYTVIIARLLQPEFLRDGADRGIELERLAQPFAELAANAGHPPPWGIYRAELQALERLDVPYFNFVSDSDALLADEREVAPSFFLEPGLRYVVTRLQSLDEEDLKAQTNFIRVSFHTRFFGRNTQRPLQPSADDDAIATLSGQLTRAEFIEAAVDIAKQIRVAAISGEDGGATWLSLAFDSTTERASLLPMVDNFYDGRLGVALFLSALENLTSGAGFHDLALAALIPLRKHLRQLNPNIIGRSDLGGATGLGSQLYTLVRIAGFLRDPELLDLACRVTHCFTSRQIVRDEALDVIGGAAGGILGLLRLFDACANGDALASAVDCGQHLLKTQAPSGTGHRAWPVSWAGGPLTGFGHGAAGIAYSLLRLSQATNEVRFRDAAEEGIAYEASVYSRIDRNWPDFRDSQTNDHQSFMMAWCNGATGIGLGRLGGLISLDNQRIRDDIRNALETTSAAATNNVDHLCCGNSGRIDFLLEAGKRLGRPDLIEEARRRATTIVRRATIHGSYRLYTEVPGRCASASFFQGISGIGYLLLRLADPERVPCALLWE